MIIWTSKYRFSSRGLLLALMLFVVGCGTTSPVGSIAIGFPSSTVAVGGTMQLRATDINFLHVTSDATASATWSSSNPAVLSVNSSGLITGINTGYATIKASLGQDTGAAVITVTAATTSNPASAGLILTPANATVYVGGGQQYTAVSTSASGTSTDVTAFTKWSVAPTSIATISSAGVLRAGAAGAFTVTGVNGTKTSTADGTAIALALSSVAVTPSNSTVVGGSTQQFKAIGTYNDGSSRDLTSSVTWSTNNTALLPINASGLATAPAAATALTVNVTATLGTVSASVPVQLTSSVTITDLVVEPSSSSIVTTSAEQYKATAHYSDGTQKDVTSNVMWSSSTSAISSAAPAMVSGKATPYGSIGGTVVSVAPNGVSTAATPGTATVQASLGGKQASSIVIVTSAKIVSLAISATRDLFPAGSQQPLLLTGTFSDGSTQDLTLTANWESSDSAVATINTQGWATGVTAGNVVFTASFDGMTTSTIGFQVLPSTLISAIIAVDYPAQLNSLPEQLRFVGTYSDGSTHDLTSLATFTSSDPTIFATSGSGLAYGVRSGSAQITGTALGYSAIIQLASYEDPVTALSVFPAHPRFAFGSHLQFSALIYAQDPATGQFFQDVSQPATWHSSDPTILTIDGNGLAKSGKVGTTTVSATVLGVTTFSDTVTVTNAALTRLEVSSTLGTVAAGTGQLYTATGFYGDGSVQDVTKDVNWNTTDNTIASIDNTGLGLGMRTGQVRIIAALSGKTGSTPLTVTDARLLSVALSPGDAELPINVYKQYALIGTFSDGSMQDLTYGSVFLSPTPSIVAVYPQGVATGTSPGIGKVSAQFGYFSASTPVRVTNALATKLTLTPATKKIRVGESQQFTATGTFDDGYTQVLDGTVISTSSSPLVAPAARYGLVYGTSIGTTTIGASIYGLSATSDLTVLSNVLSSILLTPANPVVVTGTPTQLTALGIYSDGSKSDITSTVTWISSDPALLTVNSSGLAAVVGMPTTATTVTVTATGGSSAVSSSFVVTAEPARTGGGFGGGTTTAPTAIQVTPTSSHIAAGTAKQLTATAAYADGTTKDISSTVTWSSTSPATATVSATGLVTGIQAGTVSIQAQTPGVSGTLISSSIVIVSAATLQSLAVSPSGANFAAGSNQQFTLTGTYSDGTTQNLTASATWTSSAANVATISTTGLATGVAPGTVQFTGSYGGLTVTSASNTVTPATLLAIILTPSSVSLAKGTTQQFTVTGIYSDGSPRDLASSATYTTSDPTVVGINAAGLATAIGVGSAQISVSVGGKTASTQSISVTPAVLSSIAITPKTLSLAKGTTQQFTATGTFTDRTMQDLTRQVLWTSGAPQVMTIDQNGLASSSAIGSTQITAALNGVTARTGDVVVTAATLLGITLSPDTAQIAKGSSQQFTATGTFTDGTTQNLSSLVTWTSSNGSVVSVDANGLATGTGVGAVQLIASYQGKTASTSSFQVTPATLTSISFNPAHPGAAAGTSSQIYVIGTYSDGTTQDLTSTATFSSSNTAVATVNAAGVVKGLQPGTSTITVMAGGHTSSFDVNVSAATVVSLAITPSYPAAFAKGTTEQFTATATFSDGTTQNVSSGVTWVSSNPAVFTVDSNGLATGVGTGSASLTASFAGQSATTPSFLVTPATVASIAVTPRNPSIASSSTQQFTAIATYTDSSIQNVTNTVAWSSANAAVLSVSPVGLATASTTLSSTTVALTASLGTSSGSTNVTVLASTAPPATPMPVNISTTPTSLQLAAGTMKQLTATATYADGTTQDITASVTWSSTGSNIASVSANGLVTGLTPGIAGIQAQMQGQYGVLTNTSIVIVTTATLQSITISPSGANFALGSNQQFTLTGTYSDGTTQNLTSSATWSSLNPSVATISATGLATGVGGGSVRLSATYGLLSVISASNTVTPATLVSIALTPSSASFAKGTAKQFTVIGTYSDGSTRDLTSSAMYASTDPTVVSVSNAGFATGVGIGSAQVTVSDGGQTASTQNVTVTPAILASISITPQNIGLADGTTQQFHATGTFTDGTTQDLTQQTVWTSSNPQVLTIDQNGLATGGSVGNVQVSAAFNGVTASPGTINVTPATLASLTISPTTAQIAKGTTQQFSATGVFTDGTTQDLSSTVAWNSSNGAVVSIDGHGLASGTGVGSAQLMASYLGKTTSTSSFAVTPATLVSLSFNPANPTVASGTTTHVTVLGVYSDGTTQDLTSTATLSSSNPLVASVGANGSVQGILPGTSTITVTAGGQTSSFNVAVSVAVLTSIAITPANPANFAKGTTQQFTAMGTFSDGSTQNLTSSATWSSSNTSVFTVNSNGLATGTGIGSASLTATYAGQTATTPAFQVTPAVVASIAVTPQNQSLIVGNMQQYTATATYTDSTTADVSSTARWSSSNTSIATINSSGLVSATAAGNTTITAQLNGQSGTSTLTVTTPSVTLVSVAVTPQGQSVVAGNTQQYRAFATYSDNSTADVTSTSAWSSSYTSVATINRTGLVSTIAAGSAIVTAQLNGRFATSTLTVTAAPVAPMLQQIVVTPASSAGTLVSHRASVQSRPTAHDVAPGATQQFIATGVYSDQSTQDITTLVSWSSSLTSVATINSTGLASALAAGTTSIQAQLNGLSDAVNFTVTAPAVTLQSITITPYSGSVAKGNTQQFTAAGLYSDGSTQSITTQVTWQSSVPAVANIDSNGLASSIAGGNTQIWASLSGQSAVATLTVSPATLTSLAITPQTASIASGTTQQYKAIGTLTDGSTQDLTNSVNWSTSNSSLAIVNATGFAVTAGTGSVSIVASAGAVASTATLTITTATANSIQVTPSPLSLPAGGSQQLLVTATFTDGSSQNVTSAATFVSSNSSVVTVDSNGNLKAVGPGTATVAVTLNGVTTTLSVTVGNATVTSIAITPQNPTLAAGQSQQLTATATYSDGSTEDLTSTVTWASSNSTVATVSPTGNVIVAQTGTANISATYGGVSASATITGTAAVATAIAVSPASTALAAGQAIQFAATATMSDGTQQTVTTSVHWSVSDPTKASVSNSTGSNGLLTANAAGALNVVASLNSISGAAAVTVQAATLSSLTINPSAIISLPAGITQQLSVTGAYSDGSSADVTSLVTWSTSQASTAYVDNNAVLHGVSSGLTTINAVLKGVTGTSVVTVDHATLRSIAITPAAPVLALGQTLQLTATGTYSDGSTSNITTQVQWNSGTPRVATVSGTGLLTTLATGSSSLTATLNGVSQSTPLTVSTAVLQSIAVQVANGNPASFALGTSLQLKAVGTYSDGSTQDLTSSVTWSSQTPAVGVVSSTGLATGVTPGTFNARATKSGITGSLSITVASASLVSIAITPTNAIIVNISTSGVQFTATGTFSDGSTQNLTNTVHWGTAGLTVGSISATGAFTPTGVGIGQITANLTGVTGTVGVVVVSLGL
jgi:uncharacterized protein YjdB